MTPRDRVWASISKSRKIQWTTEEVLRNVDGEVSECTVRDTLNAMTQAGVMTHKQNSPYWYVHPDV